MKTFIPVSLAVCFGFFWSGLGLPISAAACQGPASGSAATQEPAAGTTPAVESPATSGADSASQNPTSPETDPSASPAKGEEPQVEYITLGAGCFWCVEAVFDQLNGVISVESGYMGGATRNPTYEQICTGTTGHAEVCRIAFDPQKISLQKLLEVFWTTHDPTTLNSQGPDFGTQYRSAIFYTTEEQREFAEQFKARLNESNVFGVPVVTEITPASEFYIAEDYHQEYFKNNPRKPYCRAQIVPKMKKLKKFFADQLKEEAKDSDKKDSDKDD